MADLIQCKTFDYKKLAETYGDFRVPAVRVKIGTKQYNSATAKGTQGGESMIIYQADAWLYHAEGSSVSILFGNVYDLEASKFQETAFLGEKMKVEIGYGSTFQQIFTGYVGEIQFQFLGVRQFVRITGFDAVTMMSQNYNSQYYQKKKYSDVVSQIIGNYRSILASGKIDSAGEQPQPVISCCDINDYAYIRDIICPLAGKEFYIFDGKAYFQKVKNRNQTPTIQLKLGQSLYDFQMTSSYANLEIMVNSCVGADSDKKISKTASGKTDTSQKSAVSVAQKQYVPWIDAIDDSAAENCAEYWLQQQIADRQTAEGRCIGLPELVPGRCISIQGIQSAYNSKKFWIDHVHHKMNENGFVSEFYVKGWS